MAHFTNAEFKSRQKKTIQELERRGLHGLLMFKQESMYYLTGYETFGYCFFQAMYLGADGKIFLLTRLPDAIVAREISILAHKDIHVWTNLPDANPSLDLKRLLESRRVKETRIGVEYDAYGLTGAIYRKLSAALTDFCLPEDASDLVSRLRFVKSPTEIGYIRKAAALADRALVCANRMTMAGAHEGDILAAMQSEIFRGGGDWPGNDQIIGAGRRALLGRYVSGRQTLKKNDQMTIEWAGSYLRYHAAMMRTLVIGKAKPRQRKMHDIAVEAHRASAAALKPGNTCGDVFAAYARVCDKHGMRKHRQTATGYSMGAVFQPTWMDWPMFYKDNPTVIEAGNTFFIHSVLCDEGTGLATAPGQSYVVTNKGAQPLSKSSLDLVIND
ncbi:MAG: Xaa-Pro peptidase family protein [Alphaproteobacteria bacterium]|nr:Xaa-Pro peptidase family protein [Alphaproteobacteria bacterium]